MSTTLEDKIPGWYIEFQAAALRQLPRPDTIDQETAHKWCSNQNALQSSLARCLQNAPDPPNKRTRTRSVFKILGTTKTPATHFRFHAQKSFRISEDATSEIMMCGIGEHFTRRFLMYGDKPYDYFDEPIPAHELQYVQLLEQQNNQQIINELGGKEKAEITLTEVFLLMQQQGKGQSGPLSTDGSANLFCVPGNWQNITQIVSLVWNANGWFIGASDNRHQNSYWQPGRPRIFHRISS